MALLKENEEVLISGEDLFHRPDLGPCELVNGRIVPLPPTGPDHGFVESNFAGELRSWARSTGLGRVLTGEVGLYIRRNPDTVRGADVMYISHGRYARRGSSGYLDVPPELVVEVLSPDDRWSNVTEKIEEYFSAGVDRVIAVDAKLRRVFVYRSLSEVRQLQEGEEFVDEELLPGFRLPVSDLFL